jgi:hypothetical protein
MSSNTSDDERARREANWAPKVDRIKVTDVPAGAANLNVDGREVMSPMQGFGPLWQKTYRVRLAGAQVTPAEAMRAWKENFPKFQPPENRFYPTMSGVKPGEVLFISAMLPAWPGSKLGFPVSAGVMVLYADDEMFTVMTPAGFPEAGWNTFSAFADNGVTVLQIQSMARTNDPIYEFGFRFFGGAAQQEKIWAHVLTQAAAHFGVNGQVQTELKVLDSGMQWRETRNIWHNAIIRTVFYKLGAPFRWIGRLLRGSK